ncbi:MAG TPA: alpha-amylase family glycosyl hydrolase [Bacteroidota bacterium]|nr:alpha-amylase family glycosyl hydrolase [Bacteroidota bacterium]
MPSRPAIQISLTKFPPFPMSPARRRPVFEFHILASARETYSFDEELFSISGKVIFPDFHAVRVFAQKINARREAHKFPERAVKAGHLNAMGLIDEILHYVLTLYEETANPGVFSRAIKFLEQRDGKSSVEKTLRTFVSLFPPRDVYKGAMEPETYLRQIAAGKPNTEITLEELILLFISNLNPAFEPFKELFDDAELSKETSYRKLTADLEEFFRTEKRFGPDNQHIFDLLRAPMLASPHSLEGQLEFIRKRWGMLLSDKFLKRILGAGDLLKEEARLVFPPGTVPARTVVPEYPPWGQGADSERFTADLDWMPRVVVLAKNTYVWLDQLSKKYRRGITKLDQIPDEELDRLARWNITGLWLIGIWERSSASQKIKQMTGNPEAVASAYSIYDYEISSDLGGDPAFLNLRQRAWDRGIRMAGDMVPNHMGIYSRWVVERPDYFIQSDYSPFPNYRFTGANLSENPGVEVRIEDGYWTRRDAAVVFQRTETQTGNVRYIYHGNDGTSMPWNDTAQLDFLKEEVREAVIQTILHVARKFSIIRFDAAMTLTKQHFQRLWYPQPGSGGDIPSRADHAMTKEEFDRLFPREFWREVVDRINAEMPDTLLLAEAFWLLEGYFVRTLGMHRVYNSAFMHMLMKEENAKYRALIKNTLAYNPEILKRYVNFMSNPDEQTAIAQFGKDDKYFGVALMMVTLPGLPMFAHGQVEGFTEKYGMEYKRAYYDENPDEELIRRHEREIFPLVQKRYLFSGVENFELYELRDHRGVLNENVFAYSNMARGERALICYHNKYEECAGSIKSGVPKIQTAQSGPSSRNLAESLALDSRDHVYYLFRERKTGLEFLRPGRELAERGLHVELGAFQYQVFMDFREVYDETGDYSRLAGSLGGRGVPDVQEALIGMRLKPVHEAFSAMLDSSVLDRVRHLIHQPSPVEGVHARELATLTGAYERFVQSVSDFLVTKTGRAGMEARFREDLEGLRIVSHLLHSAPAKNRRAGKSSPQPQVFGLLRRMQDPGSMGELSILLAWLSTRRLGELISEIDVPRESAVLVDRLRIESLIHRESPANRVPGLLKIIIRYQDAFSAENDDAIHQAIQAMLDDDELRQALHVNEHGGVLYYNKEALETLLDWLFLASIIKTSAKAGAATIDSTGLKGRLASLRRIKSLSDQSGYRLDGLKKALAVPSRAIEQQA